MAKAAPKVVFFLDPAGDRGRAAEAEFNAVAGTFGLPWVARSGTPGAVDPAAALVIAFDQAVAEQLPPSETRVEVWDAGTPVGGQVNGLVARLLGGRVVADEPKPPPAKPAPPKKVHTVRVGRETAGRRGKGVTTVFDLSMSEDAMKELAATLKQKCGTGGTVKDGRIEIQGDQREKIVAELEKMGYKVKRTGS